MAKKISFVLIVILLSAAVNSIYAQSELTIDSNNSDLSKENSKMRLTLNLNTALDSVLYIEMPEKMSAVPIMIQNNKANLWLKNSSKIPKKTGTVMWTVSDNILMFKFLPGLINAGDLLTIDFMVKYRGRQSDTDKILIRTAPQSAVIAETGLNTLKR
jgi:hypothetical protein